MTKMSWLPVRQAPIWEDRLKIFKSGSYIVNQAPIWKTGSLPVQAGSYFGTQAPIFADRLLFCRQASIFADRLSRVLVLPALQHTLIPLLSLAGTRLRVSKAAGWAVLGSVA